ncbi:ArdC family protein [Pedobacter sp. GR22-6]|uniref:ArdC family protein n=1 Tax=Pedobacter sp. GR22-6 TaxID=3127957 RepID=UPI00307F2868
MKNFKSIAEQIGNKILVQLEKYLKSPSDEPFAFQPLSTQPVNASTGKNYQGLNALWLSMQGHEDPRWVTQLQARKNGWEIGKSARPVLITFSSYSERKPLKNGEGKNLRDENGKVKYERITRPEPVTEKAWVFNASQINGMPALVEFMRKQPEQNKISTERIEKLLSYSVGHDDQDIRLKRQGYQSNEPMNAQPGSAGFAAENLRELLSAMLYSTELKTPYGFEIDKADAKHLISHLKNAPNAVQSAAEEARNIIAYTKNLETQGLQKESEMKPLQKQSDFALSDQISYKDKVYEVTRIYKNGRVEVQDQSSKQKIKMEKTDGLYRNLLESKAHPALSATLKTSERKADTGTPSTPNEQQLSSLTKIKR